MCWSSPLSDQRVAVLHAQCNGNPFFITELLTLLAARRAEAGIPGDLVDAAVLEREEALPGTVRQTLARRLDRLALATRALLRAGAVLGLRFGVDLVAALVRQERAACEDALDEAVAAGLLREEGIATGGGYALVHSLLRRTLYEELLPGQRRRLHERAGAELAVRATSNAAQSKCRNDRPSLCPYQRACQGRPLVGTGGKPCCRGTRTRPGHSILSAGMLNGWPSLPSSADAPDQYGSAP